MEKIQDVITDRDYRMFPPLNFPSNQLVAEKTDYTIRLWQKLCICYSLLQISAEAPNSTERYLKGNIYKKVMRLFAAKIMEVYSEIIPKELTIEELLCTKHTGLETFGAEEDLAVYYEDEFTRIRSLLSSSYMKLWERINLELNTLHLDTLLLEFRKRLYNGMRRRSLSSTFDRSWFPLEWLCFVTFGISQESREQIIFAKKQSRALILQNPQTKGVKIYTPEVSFLYNPLPKTLSRKSFKMWQKMCISFTMIEFYRSRETNPNSWIGKSDFLERTYSYYSRLIVESYASHIPQGLTANMLCQCSLSDINLKQSVNYLNAEKILRFWSQITSQINKFGLLAWSESVLPFYSVENLKDPTILPIILATFRRKWWELQRKYLHLDEVYDSSWYSEEWLAFLGFGPLSKTPYFTIREPHRGIKDEANHECYPATKRQKGCQFLDEMIEESLATFHQECLEQSRKGIDSTVFTPFLDRKERNCESCESETQDKGEIFYSMNWNSESYLLSKFQELNTIEQTLLEQHVQMTRIESALNQIFYTEFDVVDDASFETLTSIATFLELIDV